METDLFRSDLSVHAKAAAVACMIGGGVSVKREPNKPTMLHSYFFAPDGRLCGDMFVPGAAYSKGVIPQMYKYGASAKFADKLERIFNGNMSSEEVVKACYDECVVRYSTADISKFVEENPNTEILSMPERLEKAFEDLREYDVCRVPSEMVENLKNLIVDTYGKKKIVTKGEQMAQ
jgi:hypothetical protein